MMFFNASSESMLSNGKMFLAATLFIVIGSIILSAGEAAPPPTPPKPDTQITIYNPNVQQDYGYYGRGQGQSNNSQMLLQQAQTQGLGVVKVRRKLDLKKGVQDILFTDVAALIDGTSVLFEDETDAAGTKVLEQNFDYDLVNSDKLLEKYLGKEIEIATADRAFLRAILLSYDGAALTLQEPASGQVIMIRRDENLRGVTLGKLPEGLIVKPTLRWKLAAEKEGPHTAVTTYQTAGMTWRADYTAVLAADEKTMAIGGWVTVANASGARYIDAMLKLVAGDVRRVQPQRQIVEYEAQNAAMEKAQAAPSFREQAFFEYHLYTLQRPATVENNQTKQIELLNAPKAAATKVYIYDGAQDEKKVRVNIKLKNSEQNGMGLALPKGIVRVYKKDPVDQSLEFIGEDQIDHTPKDEEFELYLGNAFDVVGERKRTDYKQDRKQLWETYEIKLRNHKKEAVKVEVMEHLQGYQNWEILQKSSDYEKKDSQTLKFIIEIQPDKEAVLTYQVHYSWN